MRKILCALLCLGILSAQSDFEEYFRHLTKKGFSVEFSKLGNPFLNPNVEKIYNLRIQAIFPGKAKINNVWYKEGDRIGQVQVRAIQARQVLFEYDEVLFPLKLKSNDEIYIH